MRRRLALLVAATTSVVVLAFLVPLTVLVGRVAASEAVTNTDARTQAVVSAVASGAGDDEVAGIVAGLKADGLAVRVREAAPGSSPRQTTVTRTSDGGAQVRQPVVVGGRTLVVESVVPAAEMTRGVLRARLVLALLAVVLVGLSLLVADRLARSITAPITNLADTAELLAHGDLSARATPGGPDEVRDVGLAVNLLASRISTLLTGERESVADLSHRLRTPVTALRLDVESLPAGSDRERLTGAVDELTRQLDALIREARRPVREGVVARCDAREVVAERVAFWQPLAEDQGRTVQLVLPGAPCPVGASAADLEVAVDALLTNVVAHTPEQTDFEVRLSADTPGAGALLVVTDDGPGFPDSAVLGRGESRAGSTGLGLDIARRTAAASGGDLRIGSGPHGGARVSMRLGPPLGPV